MEMQYDYKCFMILIVYYFVFCCKTNRAKWQAHQ